MGLCAYSYFSNSAFIRWIVTVMYNFQLIRQRLTMQWYTQACKRCHFHFPLLSVGNAIVLATHNLPYLDLAVWLATIEPKFESYICLSQLSSVYLEIPMLAMRLGVRNELQNLLGPTSINPRVRLWECVRDLHGRLEWEHSSRCWLGYLLTKTENSMWPMHKSVVVCMASLLWCNFMHTFPIA